MTLVGPEARTVENHYMMIMCVCLCCVEDAGADHERRSLSTMELEEPSEEKVIVGIVS